MSSFLFATNAADASPAALAVTAKSLRRLGFTRRPWFLTNGPASCQQLAGRRITIGDDESAEWVVFVAAGDRVKRDSLKVATTIAAGVDVLYGDTRHDIKRDDPLPTFQRRPAFSPERLRSHDYIGGFIMARRSLVNAAGGIELLTSVGAHDRNLRLTEKARQVFRSPVIFNVTPNPNLLPSADQVAVAQHLQRTGIAATAILDPMTPSVRVERTLTRQPKVSVIIPTRGSSAELRGVTTALVVNAVQTLIERSTYQNFEIIVVADTPTPPEVRAELMRIGGDRILIVDYDKAFNFAVKNNIGVAHSSGEFVLLLNDDAEIISPDALTTMLAIFEDGKVGIVGPMLYFEDGSIQSAGHAFTPDPKDMYRLKPADIRGAHNYVRVQREVSSVIAACLLTSREVFDAVGGLSTQFPSNWNDIDFALKVQQAGYAVILTPHAKFFHFESKTRVPLRVESEISKLGGRWGDILDDDPFYNPLLRRYHYMWISDLHIDADHFDPLDPVNLAGKFR